MNSLKRLDELELAYARNLPVIECKGPSAAQENLAQQQAQQAAQEAEFFKSVQAQQQAQFAKQSDVLDKLNAVWQPIFQAGPNQHGYSQAQLDTLHSIATEGTAADYQKATKAFQEQTAARGGGNAVIPSGADNQIRSQIASAGAADSSNKNLAISNADYETGRQNWLTAGSALNGTLNVYNPAGYTSAATGAGGLANSGLSAAFGDETTLQNERNAASPWGTIAGLVGGAASAFLGGSGGFLGTLGKNLAGGNSSSSGKP
jgi:hypothetical protein